jgi:CheY-like chemotaxis protein
MNATTITPSILLIENSPDDIDLALRAMRECGIAINVTVVRDGALALDYLRPQSKSGAGTENRLPRLIVLDDDTPSVNVLEVIRHIRENDQTRRIPIILLTTPNSERDVNLEYEKGADGYIQKPLDAKALGKTLDNMGFRETADGHPRNTAGNSP